MQRKPQVLAVWVALFALTSLERTQPQAVAAQDGQQLTFEIYQDAGKAFRWRLKAANGNILATPGQGFSTKRACRDSVERIQEGVGSDKYKAETYQDARKEYRWRLIASNGQNVASSSQGYSKKEDCDHALDVIKKSAKAAKVAEAQ